MIKKQKCKPEYVGELHSEDRVEDYISPMLLIELQSSGSHKRLPLINCYLTPYSVLMMCYLCVNCCCFHLYSYPDLQHAIYARNGGFLKEGHNHRLRECRPPPQNLWHVHTEH